jgi:hypothetical protein
MSAPRVGSQVRRRAPRPRKMLAVLKLTATAAVPLALHDGLARAGPSATVSSVTRRCRVSQRAVCRGRWQDRSRHLGSRHRHHVREQATQKVHRQYGGRSVHQLHRPRVQLLQQHAVAVGEPRQLRRAHVRTHRMPDRRRQRHVHPGPGDRREQGPQRLAPASDFRSRVRRSGACRDGLPAPASGPLACGFPCLTSALVGAPGHRAAYVAGRSGVASACGQGPWNEENQVA